MKAKEPPSTISSNYINIHGLTHHSLDAYGAAAVINARRYFQPEQCTMIIQQYGTMDTK
jgi:hypothetical protein